MEFENRDMIHTNSRDILDLTHRSSENYKKHPDQMSPKISGPCNLTVTQFIFFRLYIACGILGINLFLIDKNGTD